MPGATAAALVPPGLTTSRPRCSSCLDVVKPGHTPDQCPHSFLLQSKSCIDCLLPVCSPEAAFSDDYRCTCQQATRVAVAAREEELSATSTAQALACTGFPAELSPFVRTALPDNYPAARAVNGAGTVRLLSELELIMPARLLRSTGPSVHCCQVDIVQSPEPQIMWDRWVKHNLPVKVVGAMDGDGWEQPLAWTPEYLKANCGHNEISVRVVNNSKAAGQSNNVGSNGSTTDTVFGDAEGHATVYDEKTITLGEFLDAATEDPDHCPYYAARLVLEESLAELNGEIPTDSPFRCCFGEKLFSGVVGYIGAGGNATPTHLDLYENSFHVVQGSKRLVLYPPGQANLLHLKSDQCHYSAIPPGCEQDVGTRFKGYEHAKPLYVTVNAGETLYLPFGWFHQVTGDSFNILISHFYCMRPEKRARKDTEVDMAERQVMACGKKATREYEGELGPDGRPNGAGEEMWSDLSAWVNGFKYVGQFSNGKWHGAGTFSRADGSRYTGNFEHGKCEGAGEETFVDGRRYKGQYCEGTFHGEGKEWRGKYHSDGAGMYDGQFKWGLRNGRGTETYNAAANPHTFCGQFESGVRNGEGTTKWAGGDKYEGQYQDNRQHGQGKYTFADGNSYQGQYVNGAKHGEGVFEWAKCGQYQGQWENGAKHGQGSFTRADGKRWTCAWKEGVAAPAKDMFK